MRRELPRRGHALRARGGFTLIELIVVLLILALLAAVVIPVVAERANDADPTRVATDLQNLTTGYNLFHLDNRPRYAGDLEDLVFVVSTTDANDTDITGAAYSTDAKWDGPYMDFAIAEGGQVATGAGGFIQDNLSGIENAGVTTGTPNTTTRKFIAATLTGIDADEFGLINNLIDGEGETNSSTAGKFRFASPNAFYVLSPYKN